MKKEWWHDKVAYQIYPKSFYDSNGDGIGDIPGIIEKLDYLKELGADILWLSPVYCSPLADQGYDISDYYGIDPRFGTMEDMDRLIDGARKRGMYVLMDLVVNHCSDEHEWFRRACEDPEGEYGKYFYLRKLKKDGCPSDPWSIRSPDGYVLPCNWRSYFGGPVWEKLPGHEDWFYLHVFHRKQPDLNWENPRLREEIFKMVNWWLDRGLAGFRIDAIMNIKKALPFKNYAPDRTDGMCSIRCMLHDASGIGQFLGELQDRCFSPHGAFTVGEVFDEKEEELPDFIGQDGYFSTMFDFSETVWGSSPEGWHDNGDITPDAYRDCIFFSQKRVSDVGFLSNIIENHDEPRGVSRYLPRKDMEEMEEGMRIRAKKALATAYFFVRGLPWIYQGQELGMENVPLHTIEDVDDISSLDAWNVMRSLGIPGRDALRAIERYGRDNARTPFQWSGGQAAGFSTGDPWLRPNPNYPELNLELQRADPASVFHHYRKMTALRKSAPYRETLVWGSFEPCLTEEHDLIAYLRRPAAAAESGSPAPVILVLVNFCREPRRVSLPSPLRRILLDNCAAEIPSCRPADSSGSTADGSCTKAPDAADSLLLEGYQALVLEL